MTEGEVLDSARCCMQGRFTAVRTQGTLQSQACGQGWRAWQRRCSETARLGAWQCLPAAQGTVGRSCSAAGVEPWGPILGRPVPEDVSLAPVVTGPAVSACVAGGGRGGRCAGGRYSVLQVQSAGHNAVSNCGWSAGPTSPAHLQKLAPDQALGCGHAHQLAGSLDRALGLVQAATVRWPGQELSHGRARYEGAGADRDAGGRQDALTA